ncbi:MAG TPA: beta-ketoacyl-[acyl-carrier-protein] synthase family protein [Micropepsaceae bacterium]|nr:beta-ketoacyl-[acyl-carrier-protein] synthase family protein [Micropepsaceae bacterium]
MRKVVVTGMGCVSGLGADKTITWDSLVAGKSAIRPISLSPEGERELCFAGAAAPAVPDALRNLAARYEDKQLNVDLFSNFAAAATLEALEDSGIWGDAANLSDAAIIYGSASGGNAAMEAGYARLFLSRLNNVHPLTIPRLMNSAAASHLSMLFGIRGHCLAISSACASSAHAIGEAMHFIRSGRSSIVITGGSDASLTFGSLQGWKALQAMAPDMCRPFSIDRKGMVLGEGAATLVLEDEKHALKRGARIYAEVAGAGSTSDAAHLTQPNADRAAAAIRAAHADAQLDEDAPILFSAHGTGTRLNDRSEASAFQLAYPSSASKHVVIATKSAHGHMLGATGAMEFVIAILALTKQTAPPVLGFLGPDPECDLPLALKPTKLSCHAAVSASFAFGGLNSVLIAKTPNSG